MSRSLTARPFQSIMPDYVDVIQCRAGEAGVKTTGEDSIKHDLPDTGLTDRLRHGQTDLDDAIALLRSLDLDETPPAATFDPTWDDSNR